jgi:3-phytase
MSSRGFVRIRGFGHSDSSFHNQVQKMKERVEYPSRLMMIAAATVGLCGWLVPVIVNAGDGPRVAPLARVQTEPVPSKGDAADDPAIWVHPTNAARSVVLGTDKKGGLNVFDLDGRRLQVASDGSRPNNVDVIYDFPLGEKKVDLAVAGTRSRSASGVGFWRIDPDSRKLYELGPIPAFTVYDGGEPYGSCVYRSPKSKSFYVFVTSKDGGIEQYRIEPRESSSDASASPIKATKVRAFSVSSTAEGCVADQEMGWLYVSEEKVGIWRFAAEPDSGKNGTLVARVGENGLAADVEGLTIYYASGADGYVIASSQGSGSFNVYRREVPNSFVMTIDPAPGTIPDVGDCDGIDVTNVATSAKFPRGLFVCQDGAKNREGCQNFKLFGWDDIAGNRLTVDTSRPARHR